MLYDVMTLIKVESFFLFQKSDYSYFEYQKNNKIVLEVLIGSFPIPENKDYQKCWQVSAMIYKLLERLSFVVVKLSGGALVSARRLSH